MPEEIINEIVIELTRECNLDCDFCFNEGNGLGSNKFIKKEEIFSLIDSVSRMVDGIRFTGGEPLLREDLADILAYSKKKGIYTILNTNATLLDKNLQILENVDDLLISLHYLPNQNFDENLIYEIKKNHPNLFLRFCTILTKENIRNLEKFYSYVRSLPIDNWFLLRQVPNKHNLQPITPEDMKEAIDKIILLNKKYDLDVKIANALPFCVTDAGKASLVCIGARNDSGHTRIHIDSDGNIITDYFSRKKLGNIKKDKIVDIWNGEEMKKIRKMSYAPKCCGSCRGLDICKAGLSNPEYTDYLVSKENL